MERFEDEGAFLDVTVTGPAELLDLAAQQGFETVDLLALGRTGLKSALEDWAPDLLLWMDQDLPVHLFQEVDARRLPRLMIDAGRGGTFPDPGWRPGRLARLLSGFARILCVTEEARRHLVRLGASRARSEVTGAFRTPVAAPPYDASHHARLISQLDTRPVWLAADLPASELTAVISAYRLALRRLPRLLLVIVPSGQSDIARMLPSLEGSPYHVLQSASEVPITEDINIALAAGPDDAPLWISLAPVTYMGGTLTRGHGRSPMIAASLGSAIIHGPQIAAHPEDFARFEAAGAARAIRNRAELGAAVQAMLAPDEAAKYALAGWQVSSAGATVGHRIHDLIRELLGWRG